MTKPKIIGTYRVKNEERFLEKSLKSVMDICSEIVILDDGSSDKTVKICSSFDKVVDIQTQSNLSLDEVRDRNFLLQMSLKRKPDYILSIDGDEIFMPNSAEILFEELEILYTENNIFEFQFLNLWDKPNQIRFDGAHSNIWQKRLFRLKDQPKNLKINETGNPGNFHCGSIPNNTVDFESPIRSNVKIFHVGKFEPNLRQKKYEWYTGIDPNNPLTDNYQHLISSKGKFSGKHGYEFKIIPNEFVPSLIQNKVKLNSNNLKST